MSENLKDFMSIDESNKLQFLHSIKFFNILLVIISHCIMFFSIIPFDNAEFIEEVHANNFKINLLNNKIYLQKFKEPYADLFLNGTIVVQTFFVLSGFLMGTKFIKVKITIKHFIQILGKRYFK